jgi:hypothetical protein
VLDPRSPEEIVGYDEHGLPRQVRPCCNGQSQE